ncbi:hypothetical protein ACTNA4_11620 [Bariatricus sp. HCP28S3_A7]|uniref:hypothetical protein n=1 Tax=Bariatricus sp. HCP28S3_A7 TaxID=3438894 RepID=UPI003F8C1F44
MSMETLNVIQFTQLFVGYIGFTVGLPALVFYRKARRFPAAVRFLIYFTIGNFYVINLVQVLELLHISYRATLFLFTFVPAFLLFVKLYNVPVISYVRKVLDECRHYILRELGFKSFVRNRWNELKVPLRAAVRNLWRLVKENILDVPFLVIFGLLVWKVCGPGILHNWGYGASDIPVHNYWINGLIENNIYVAGIYPMGMHCMLYYLATMLGIPVYVTLRLFWLVQYSMIAVMILVFLKGHCKTRFLPYLGVMLFVGSRYFVGIAYSRYGATLPQEYGMLYILPPIFFVMEFFKTRKEELDAGINCIRCTSSWHLLGFAMSFSMTLSSHFYDTIIAGIICIGVAVGYGYWFWRKEYFWRIMLSGVLSFLMAFLPMAVAFLTGKSLQGSMYWAMNVIGLRDYTVLIFRIICIGVVLITVGGIVLIVRGIKSGKISFENKEVQEYSLFLKLLSQVRSLLIFAAVLWVGWRYRETILWGCKNNAFSLENMNYVLYGIGIALVIGVIQRYLIEPMRGSGIFAMVSAEIFLGLLLVSGALGWPMLMEPYRACIYFAYLIPVLIIMTLDGAVNILLLARLVKLQQAAGFVIASMVIVVSTKYDWIRGSFGGGGLEMNEAILCTTNILKDNEGQNDTWTIVSANDELRMIEEYGRHTETIEFLEDMEYWNRTKEVTIPTEKVYFYIEKKPLNYANGYGGEIPEVSEEQAEQALPDNSGLAAYNGPRRSITMSRMYYWAQRFMELYPNEMKVYFENDNFVCYYIEQNVYRLYNFAINYGYN